MEALINEMVAMALKEDIGLGDITAKLVPETVMSTAKVITREDMVFCGRDWVVEVFSQVDYSVKVEMKVTDGDHVSAGSVLFTVTGPARSLLTAERTALNFLQLLSGTATITKQYVDTIRGMHTKLLDTRKTLPLYRLAQKYAVKCGGGHNHRIGLFDAYLIKENHINACGSIDKAVYLAKEMSPGKPVEVEVESLEELKAAIVAKADIVMLDNFTIDQMYEAVQINQGALKLEVSGNVSLETIKDIAKTGVDYISVGALTKHIQAIDLSMRMHS